MDAKQLTEFNYLHSGLSVPRQADISSNDDSVWAVNRLMADIEAAQPPDNKHKVALVATSRPISVFDGEVEKTERLARVFNKKLVWFSDMSGEGIAGVAEGDNRIFVNINSDRPVSVVAGHELCHWMQTEAPDVYAQYKETVLRVARNTKEYQNSRAEHYKGDRWKDEFVADFMGEALNNPSILEAALGREPSLFDKVASFTLDGIKRIGEALHLVPKEEKDASVLGAITDMRVAQEAVISAVRTYSTRSPGLHLASLDRTADFLYAGQNARGFKTAEREGAVFAGKYDNKPRFEISDHNSRMQTENFLDIGVEGCFRSPADAKLDDVLEHAGLFRAYPEMRDVKASITINPANNNSGLFDERDGNSSLVKVDASSFHEARLILLHEVQHWIQGKEDFARGDNPDALRAELKLARLMHDVEVRDLTTSPEMVAFRKEFADRYGINFVQAVPDAKITGALVESFTRGEVGMDAKEMQTFIDKHPAMKKARREMNKLNREMQSVRSYGIGADAAYLRSAGEIESRDVSKRADLTDEERANKKPYSSERIPVSKAFVTLDEEAFAAHRQLPQGQSICRRGRTLRKSRRRSTSQKPFRDGSPGKSPG